MNRERALERLRSERFDVLIVGGGATGVGCALDAASRGYATALIEAEDFAKATSSRSTKLIHGGVRYLRQGNIALVREALLERQRLRCNAPQYVHPLEFFVPGRNALERAYSFAGLALYDLLAGRSDFPRSRFSPGGVTYWDAQFDDARLAIAIARTAAAHGAAIANYTSATALHYADGRIAGAEAVDRESGDRFVIRARSVVNAAGIFVDRVRKLDDPHCEPLLAFSRGTHIVVALDFLPSPGRAILVPQTADGRVIFAIPWHGAALIGTTDVPAENAVHDPTPTPEEIDYLIQTAAPYLTKRPARIDVRSAFAGLRPLLKARASNTSHLSREHATIVSKSGLVTIAGGKWTTYRKMAQDAVDVAARTAELALVPCRTMDLPLCKDEMPADPSSRLSYAVNHEMARTLEDFLARRTRLLFLDAAEAIAQAPGVSAELARLLGREPAWAAEQTAAFGKIARTYVGEPHPEAKSKA